MTSRDHDVPLLHGTFTIRSPRSVVLLQPFQLAIAVALTIVSVVFTIWPEVLDHTPVSFERRGLIHHTWHYLLLAGSVSTLAGMFSAGPRRLKIELVGLCLLIGALSINLTSAVAAALATRPPEMSGLVVAMESAIIVGLVLRAFIVATEPTVDLRSTGGE